VLENGYEAVSLKPPNSSGDTDTLPEYSQKTIEVITEVCSLKKATQPVNVRHEANKTLANHRWWLYPPCLWSYPFSRASTDCADWLA